MRELEATLAARDTTVAVLKAQLHTLSVPLAAKDREQKVMQGMPSSCVIALTAQPTAAAAARVRRAP